MTRITAILIAAAMTGVAGTASAGPCEDLAGYRWASFIEGGHPGRTGAGTWDFRRGVVGGKVFGNEGATPLPGAAPSAAYGASSLQQVNECRPGRGRSATLAFNSGASLIVTLAADGRSATLVGEQNLAGMTGWIVRDPT
ncbi:hypothetical protein [Brevundimonas sp.]|uniref:hypothetical protein n=1 Tax=Brevundimonas sp. TaxID=1871086 RepID=UPI002D3F2CEB|nr:hypothetical protein [Brevundimonas sp.]HYD27771.1 hypothetical protein [Brevundimonas sp.]